MDLGTGGGERLAAFSPHPRRFVATESYAPNVLLAARRLAPLGIQLVRTSGAPDIALQRDSDAEGRLPFREGSFHLAIDRNEALVAREVARILTRGGVFVTEQTGSNELPELSRLLDLPPSSPQSPVWGLGLAKDQLTRAGLKVTDSNEARSEMRFQDVVALVWYLQAVPWAVPGFSVETPRARLEDLHERVSREGPIRIQRYAFWMGAKKE